MKRNKKILRKISKTNQFVFVMESLVFAVVYFLRVNNLFSKVSTFSKDGLLKEISQFDYSKEIFFGLFFFLLFLYIYKKSFFFLLNGNEPFVDVIECEIIHAMIIVPSYFGMYFATGIIFGLKEFLDLFLIITISFALLFAWSVSYYASIKFKRLWDPYRTLVISGEQLSDYFLKKIRFANEWKYKVQMYVTQDKPMDVLEALIQMHDAVIFYEVDEKYLHSLLLYIEQYDKIILSSMDKAIPFWGQKGFSKIADENFWNLSKMETGEYFGKVFVDLLISFFLIVVCSPLFAIVFVIMKFYGKDNVFTPIVCMDNERKKVCYYFAASTEKTGLLNWIHQSQLDRLPALFSVLTGNLHLVGTEMILSDEFVKNMEERSSFGVFSLADLYCTKEYQDEKIIKMNREYNRNQTLWYDIGILALHLKKVIYQMIVKCEEEEMELEYEILARKN